MSSITTKKQPQTTNKTRRNRRRRIRQKNIRKQVKADLTKEHKVMIERCTAEYASALVNPFGARQTMPCVPDYIALPSFKFQTKSRGVFSTGGLGVGFVSLNPWLMANSTPGNSAGNTSYPIVATRSNFGGAAFDPSVAGGVFQTGVFGAGSNSTLAASFLTAPGRQLRLVAAGLRISYTGSNFRNQGRVLLIKSQGNVTIPTGVDASYLLNDNMTSIVPISRKSEYVFYTPDSHDLVSYEPFDLYDPNVGGTNRRSLLIYIDGGDSVDPQSWLYEAVAYFEMVGNNLTLSKSHSDPEGFGNVLEALPVRNPISPPRQVEQTIFQRLVSMGTKKLLENAPPLIRAGSTLYNSYMRDMSGVPMISIEEVD